MRFIFYINRFTEYTVQYIHLYNFIECKIKKNLTRYSDNTPDTMILCAHMKSTFFSVMGGYSHEQEVEPKASFRLVKR